MKSAAFAVDKIQEKGSPTEPGYDDWKRRKIGRAKGMAEDRDSLIPAERVWLELGLEH